MRYEAERELHGGLWRHLWIREEPVRYVFGDCVLDTERHELRRAGVPVPLERKVYHVLAYLVQHAERLVTKDELLDHVWPGVYVTDKVVTRCIAALRKAVGDTPGAQRVLQTRHGQGYRLVAPVLLQDTLPSSTAAPSLLPECSPSPAPPVAALPSAPAAPGVAPPPASCQPAPRGERKLVTILACHVSRALALAEGSDPEDQHDVLQALCALATPEVSRYGGTLHPLPGDDCLVLFGAPMAQEDHAQRAVLAACEIRERWRAALPRAAAPAQAPLALSLGVHTGVVVLGQMGVDGPVTYSAGDTIELAVRL